MIIIINEDDDDHDKDEDDDDCDDDGDDNTIRLSSSLEESGSKELPLSSARQQDSHLQKSKIMIMKEERK